MREVEVGAFRIEAASGDGARVPPLREGDGPRHDGRARRPIASSTPTPTRRCWCPGRSCSSRTRGPVDLRDHRNWWAYVPGACWHRPEGPGSDTYRRADHPVTHVTHADASAYAAWAGRSLPTEAEWERAARGGLDGAPTPGATTRSRTACRSPTPGRASSRGSNTLEDGYAGTSPVGSFPANGFGLFDVCGNVWEWTDDWFTADHQPRRRRAAGRRARDRRRVPAPRHQGRLAPVRAELLPALPAGRAAGRGDRHLDEPHRLPLRRAR